jgi:hypothetical protein
VPTIHQYAAALARVQRNNRPEPENWKNKKTVFFNNKKI